jgi:hypothetical protein
MTVDLLVTRLSGDWHAILDAWPILVVLGACVLGVAAAAVRLLHRRRFADLEERLEQSEGRLAEAKARMGRNLEALDGEHQARRQLEALVASLRDQLAIAQRPAVARREPIDPSPRNARRHAGYDELYGPGSAIDGRLTKGEAERLIRALRETTGLMKSRLGAGGAEGPMRTCSVLAGSNGAAWWRYVASKGIPHAIELVTAYRADIIDFANCLEAMITSQADLEFRLRKILGDVGPVARLLNVVGGYIRSMERLNDGEPYKPAVLEMALGAPFQLMVQAQAAVDTWMKLFVEQRAPNAHREAVAYL